MDMDKKQASFRWRPLVRILKLVACLLVIGTTPCFAAHECLKMPLSPLESESKAGKPINEVVEALLHDAETIYTEGSHIVARRPKTEIESLAIDRMERLHYWGEGFHIKECHFQNAFSSPTGETRKHSQKMQWALIRIEQFDNFIFGAVMYAGSCSNTEASFRLNPTE
jgi:hypothetical protein